jgi:hypothetical protein
MMSISRINSMLRYAAMVFVAASLLAIALGLFVPLSTSETALSPANHGGSSVPVGSSVANPPLSAFESVFARRLRDSIGDQGVASAAPSQSGDVAPPQQLTLVGTIGTSLAMIQGPDGTVALVEIGDDVDGAQAVAIRPTQVDLRLNGRIITLRKAPDAADNGGLISQ